MKKKKTSIFYWFSLCIETLKNLRRYYYFIQQFKKLPRPYFTISSCYLYQPVFAVEICADVAYEVESSHVRLQVEVCVTSFFSIVRQESLIEYLKNAYIGEFRYGFFFSISGAMASVDCKLHICLCENVHLFKCIGGIQSEKVIIYYRYNILHWISCIYAQVHSFSFSL